MGRLTLKELRQRHLEERGALLERQQVEVDELRKQRRLQRVPVGPLAAAVALQVQRSTAVGAGRRGVVDTNDRVTWSGLARTVWGVRADQSGKGDSSRMKRALGIAPHSDGSTATTIDYDMAVKIMHAAGLDPTDVGL